MEQGLPGAGPVTAPMDGTELASYLLANQADVARIIGALSIQGYMSAWNPTTGENTVTITGTQTFDDLVFVCDPAILAANVRVMLLRTAGAPVILGRIRKPPF